MVGLMPCRSIFESKMLFDWPTSDLQYSQLPNPLAYVAPSQLHPLCLTSFCTLQRNFYLGDGHCPTPYAKLEHPSRWKKCDLDWIQRFPTSKLGAQSSWTWPFRWFWRFSVRWIPGSFFWGPHWIWPTPAQAPLLSPCAVSAETSSECRF
jgi:hypothetical protein